MPPMTVTNPEKPLSEMTLDELKGLNKDLGNQITKLQARKSEVTEAFAARQEADKAAEAVKALSAHKRAALKRALEAAEAAEKKAAEKK